MIRPTATLHGKDAAIYDRLVQIVRQGVHRKAWTAHDVGRVASERLPRPTAPDPRIQALKTRNDALQADNDRLGRENDQLREINRRLNARLYPLTHDGHRVAHLTPRRAQAITEAAKGVPREQIAEHMHSTRRAVDNALYRAARDIGASGPEQAIALVAGGQVEVRAKVTEAARIAS